MPTLVNTVRIPTSLIEDFPPRPTDFSKLAFGREKESKMRLTTDGKDLYFSSPHLLCEWIKDFESLIEECKDLAFLDIDLARNPRPSYRLQLKAISGRSLRAGSILKKAEELKKKWSNLNEPTDKDNIPIKSCPRLLSVKRALRAHNKAASVFATHLSQLFASANDSTIDDLTEGEPPAVSYEEIFVYDDEVTVSVKSEVED